MLENNFRHVFWMEFEIYPFKILEYDTPPTDLNYVILRNKLNNYKTYIPKIMRVDK